MWGTIRSSFKAFITTYYRITRFSIKMSIKWFFIKGYAVEFQEIIPWLFLFLLTLRTSSVRLIYGASSIPVDSSNMFFFGRYSLMKDWITRFACMAKSFWQWTTTLPDLKHFVLDCPTNPVHRPFSIVGLVVIPFYVLIWV